MHFITFLLSPCPIKRYFAIVKNMSISPILNHFDHFPVFRATRDNLKAVLRLCFFLTSFIGNAQTVCPPNCWEKGKQFLPLFQHCQWDSSVIVILRLRF